MSTDTNLNNKKQSNTLSSRRKKLRTNLWSDISDEQLWLRNKQVGFSTIPRTMNLIGRIIDQLSEKGVPLMSTYLTLWCWVFDEAFVEIRNPKEFAYESGFNGSRAEATWRVRMKALEELGFIMSKPGIAGEFQYILILNPILIIEKKYKDRLKNGYSYSALISRLIQIGANDLDFI